MKITLAVIKADVGSIGGHTRPSERMLQTVRARLDAEFLLRKEPSGAR
jgi:fructose 1,6-bisphosphate aldolase/phosphatase